MAGLALFAGMARAEEGRAVDLDRLYFSSPQAEAEERRQFLAFLDGFPGARPLPQALHDLNALTATYARHDAYLKIRCGRDRKDSETCGALNRLEDAVDAKTASFRAKIGGMKNSLPSVYRAWIAAARRDAAHRAAPAQETMLSAFNEEVSGWQEQLYALALSSAAFGTVDTAHGKLDVRRQKNLLAGDPDPKVREAAFHKRYAALAGVRDLAAFALIRVAKAGNHKARLRGFANAPDEKYFALGLDPAALRRLMIRLQGMGDLDKRFERLRGQEPWDMDLGTSSLPNCGLAELPVLYHEAFAAIGPWYQAQFDALLDPGSGRLDILPGGAPNRYGGGFSVGYAGAPSALFVGTFDGTYKDLSVIAHEGGHAVHRALMNAKGVLPIYSDGPHFLFESAAIFNELVLADQLGRQSGDEKAKRAYAERFLAVKGLEFLAGAQDAALEQAVYDGVAAGKIESSKDLDALTLKIDADFSLWPASHDEMKSRWVGLSLAYEDPLYYVNYMLAGLVALRCFEMFEADPAGFSSRWRAFLENGFDAPPNVLLKRNFGFDLNDPALVNDAVAVVDKRLKALESS